MSYVSRMRFLGRPLTRRASNWDTLTRVMPASKQPEFQATIAAFNKRKDKAAGVEAAGPIDFDSYKEVLGAAEVDSIRAEYEKFQYSDFEAEKQTELAELQAALDKTVAAIEEQSASLSAAAKEAAGKLVRLQTARTNVNTGEEFVHRVHPEITAEAELEVENEDWDTESKPVDINALRLETLEENWDSATLGPLDEDTQKAFLEELENLEATAATQEDSKVVDYAADQIDQWHEAAGRTPDPASAAAFAKANQVTDADRAITNERELWTEIDTALELGQFERANGLAEHATALRASGDLVEDADWRRAEIAKATAARSHQDYNNPVSAEEIASLSAEELESLADEAAERLDYYRASHLIYAARVASGDVDPAEKSFDDLSGVANHFINTSKNMVQ
jgi:hypothetical protein